MKESKISKSSTSRFFKLGKTIVKATGIYVYEKGKGKVASLGNKLEKTQDYVAQIKAAKELISTMGDLKGGMMKLGQMISITDDLMLPAEISELFKVLQKDSSLMPKEDLLKQFKTSFSKSPDKLFKKFDYEPMAAASIGQVHKAQLHTGEIVAVKVQYPNIKKIVKNDIKHIDRVKSLLEKVIPNLQASDHIISELKRSLLEECNYVKEAASIKNFGEYYKDDRGIVIPKVFEDLSSKCILTMEFVEGDHFDETEDYPQDVKDKLAQMVFDFHFTSFLEHRHIHADPQSGNYLFNHDQIIVLDFGATKKFTKKFIKQYLSFLKSMSTKNMDAFEQHLIDFNFVKVGAKSELVQAFYDVMYEFYEPFTKPGKHKVGHVNPFRSIFDFAKTVRIKDKTAPDENFIMLDRANLGVYMKAKKWQSAIDWLTMLEEYQEKHKV